MKNLNRKLIAANALRSGVLLFSMMMSVTAFADRPEWAGRHGDDDGERIQKSKHGRGGENKGDDDRREARQRYRGEQDSIEVRVGGYFGDTHRSDAHDYYREQYRSGHCPPGLSRKHNGCMPPGQARRWSMGERLPADVRYEALEPEIQLRLGIPPAGHKFVRVASDILLIAVGTGMVMDAIQDIGLQ